jgi:signal-transduction protein with cAMP-binding, CBS, and nucleotidyltransferase domain
LSESSTILEVAQAMAAKRGDVALLTGPDSGLSGIFTDNDITRRVVAVSKDLSGLVSDVMTKDPKCVKSSDNAMEALKVMVTNHFRHLPVVDNDGSIVGVLDIAKCLFDVIHRLEKMAAKKTGGAQGSTAVNDAIAASLRSGAGSGANSAQLAMLQQMLGPMMEQMFGKGGVPTLKSVLAESAPLRTVKPTMTVREASKVMAEVRNAVLVVDGGLVGIFTPKDLMNRVVAKERDMDTTLVSEVMTPNPDPIVDSMDVLDALHQMHDNKYQRIPVVDAAGGVVGMVDVMLITRKLMSGENSEAFWSAAGDVDDTSSDAGSARSAHSTIAPSKVSKKGIASDTRTVKKLRPRTPLAVKEDSSILEVAKLMASKRTDAAILISDRGLSGIITDNDITRRVVAAYMETSTAVSEVMTKNPKCVKSSDSAVDALTLMVNNHFRHLPVVEDDGSIVGVLDIARCLFDVIHRLEKTAQKKAGEKGSTAVNDAIAASVRSAGGGANNAQLAMLQQMLGPMMEQMFGTEGVPTLRSLLAQKNLPPPIVKPTMNVREAGKVMAEARKAVLVVDEGELVGIFSTKDMLNRVVAKELKPDFTSMESVMTPNPDTIADSMTVLDALHQMHENKYLNIPVLGFDGAIAGVVDVMDIVNNLMSGSSAEAFWSTACDDDVSDTVSQFSHVTANTKLSPSPRAPGNTKSVSGESALTFSEGDMFVYKVTDAAGDNYRVRASAENFKTFCDEVCKKISADPANVVLKYTDDDGDVILIESTESLAEAVDNARTTGKVVLKLLASAKGGKSLAAATLAPTETKQDSVDKKPANQNMVFLAAGLGTVALLAAVGIAVMSSKSASSSRR